MIVGVDVLLVGQGGLVGEDVGVRRWPRRSVGAVAVWALTREETCLLRGRVMAALQLGSLISMALVRPPAEACVRVRDLGRQTMESICPARHASSAETVGRCNECVRAFVEAVPPPPAGRRLSPPGKPPDACSTWRAVAAAGTSPRPQSGVSARATTYGSRGYVHQRDNPTTDEERHHVST